MNTIDLGGTKLRRIGLGTNRITDTAESREILRYAVERGINFIDTAHLYTGGTSERRSDDVVDYCTAEGIIFSRIFRCMAAGDCS